MRGRWSSLFKDGGLSLLLCGQTVSVLGDFFGTAAQSVLVYRLTGSKIAMGTLWLCHLLPMVLVRLVSGPLLERINRRRLLITAEWSRVLVFAVLAALYGARLLRVGHLFAFALVTGTAEAVFFPVLMAIVPDIVPQEQLIRANTLIEGSRNIMSLIGPALGAGCVQIFGPGPALLIDALSFVGSAVAIQLLRAPTRAEAAGHAEPFLARLGEGWHFFREHAELLWIVGALAVANMGEAAFIAQLLPYAVEQLGTNVSGMGILNSTVALGAVLGTLATRFFGEIRWRSLALMGSLAVFGVSTMALSVAHRLASALPVLLLYGAGGPFFNIVYVTLYQRMVPDHLRVRVFALRMVLSTAAMPFGSYLGGVVAQAWGLRIMLCAAGAATAAAAIAVYFHPILRRIDGHLPELGLPT